MRPSNSRGGGLQLVNRAVSYTRRGLPLCPQLRTYCGVAAKRRFGPEGDIISSSSLRQRFCELAGRIDEKLGERAERTVLQRHDSTLDGGRRQGDWQDLHVGMCMEQSQF